VTTKPFGGKTGFSGASLRGVVEKAVKQLAYLQGCAEDYERGIMDKQLLNSLFVGMLTKVMNEKTWVFRK
jgi:hypothetical protein